MPAYPRPLIAFTCVALLPTLVVLAQDSPDIHIDVGLVNVAFSVPNPDGKFVTGLTAADFEVLEDGVPQTIQFFGSRNNLPLTVGLVEDFSPSQDRFNRAHRQDTETFLRQVLHGDDRAFLVCFGDRVRLVADLTASPDAIATSMQTYDRHPRRFPLLGPPEDRDGGTALFDAIFFAAREKMKHAEGRKALLVFSDGEDNSSERSLGTAIEAAQGADALAYAIRYTALKHGRLTPLNLAGIASMKRLAAEAGGLDFDAATTDLPAVFQQIGDELRSLYELGYTSTNREHDGRFRRITIRARQPGLAVRARTGYFAPSP